MRLNLAENTLTGSNQINAVATQMYAVNSCSTYWATYVCTMPSWGGGGLKPFLVQAAITTCVRRMNLRGKITFDTVKICINFTQLVSYKVVKNVSGISDNKNISLLKKELETIRE